MLNNKTFYPTPKKMIERMAQMVTGKPKNILEPSAGKGDLIEGLKEISITHDLSGNYNQLQIAA